MKRSFGQIVRDFGTQIAIVGIGVVLIILLQIQGGRKPAIVGQAAPVFEGKMLDDSTFSLEAHRGEVVVLDFWATWCPPCVEGLPIVDEVTREMADAGVVFVAVNQGETSATIKQFLETKGLDVPVVLDRSGRIGDKYGVTGIPTTVVIAPDGTVTDAHVGVSFGFEASLREGIERALKQPETATDGVQ